MRRDAHSIAALPLFIAFQKFRMPSLDKNTHDIKTLLLQQSGGYGAVHTP